ncbi:HD domain-containing protein [archaeon]|nr:HD domain-containing protein [archaeon]
MGEVIALRIKDSVYGLQEITDPAAIELINSRAMQRLKGISQEGTYCLTHGYCMTRLEHSIGVYLLLRKFKASRKEQLAGLIHDLNHPVFSHVCDLVFGTNENEDFQDKNLNAFIKETELPCLLEKHGFDADELLNLHSFKLLERDLPDLCADRIDYFLRGQLMQKLASRKKVREFLDSLAIAEGNRFAFKDRKLAKEFALRFIKLNKEYYSSPYGIVMFCLLADAMKLGLEKGVISKKELFSTDAVVYNKLVASGDAEIKSKLRLISKKTKVIEDEKNFDYRTFKKQRLIDPGVLIEGKISLLSELDNEFKKIMAKNKELKKEYKLRILR